MNKKIIERSQLREVKSRDVKLQIYAGQAMFYN